MGLVFIQNENLLVYSETQKVLASYCLPFQHSRGKNQPVDEFHPPPLSGLFRFKRSNAGGSCLLNLSEDVQILSMSNVIFGN